MRIFFSSFFFSKKLVVVAAVCDERETILFFAKNKIDKEELSLILSIIITTTFSIRHALQTMARWEVFSRRQRSLDGDGARAAKRPLKRGNASKEGQIHANGMGVLGSGKRCP